ADDIVRLNFVTGKDARELAVFRPGRMALHETIAALVTRVRMDNPARQIKTFIEENPVYKNIQAEAAKIDPGFDAMAERFDRYTEFIIDDHSHVISPQPRLRALLQCEKDAIEERIRKGDYDPRAAESRHALRDLLSDHLLRQHYERRVLAIVEEAMAE